MLNVGILLAAGFGRRFQAQQVHSDKLLMPLAHGHSVVSASLQALRQHVDQVCVVIRPDSPALRTELERHASWIVESPLAHTGMGASLADAVRALQERYMKEQLNAVLVALGDMPCIAASSMQAVLQGLGTHAIAAPLYQGQRGHPVAFRCSLMPELARLQGDEGARHLFTKYSVNRIELDDPGVCFDIDSPADLEHPLITALKKKEA